MKPLNQFTVLVLLIGLFSCGDRKSAETVHTNDTATSEGKTSPDSIIQHRVMAPEKEKSDNAVTEMTKDSLTTQKELHLPVGDTISNDEASTKDEAKDAPKIYAPVPAELKGRIVRQELPTAAAVGIRPYPNAYIIKLNPKTEYKDKTYVTIELVSPDTPDQVLEYYKRWKEDWFYMGGAGVYTFKKDKDKYFRETNTLQILTFNPDFHEEISKLLTFKPQTLIRIYYEAE